MPRIYIVELCNYDDYPVGGHLSFARQLIKAFGNEIALIGISTGDEPVKKWIKKKIGDVEYDFYSVRKRKKILTKPIIPLRLQAFLYLSGCRKELAFLSKGNVFIQTPQVLFALRKLNLENVCYRLPGVANILGASRFWYAKFFQGIYERILFSSLSKVKLILASADQDSIADFCRRSRNTISIDRLIRFPTRIDTDVFKPAGRMDACLKLRSDPQRKRIVTTGRLNQLKGWKFLIDCFVIFIKEHPHSDLYFLGDGEDRMKIENYITEKEMTNNIFITGQVNPETVALYLNSSDLYVMGSFLEGWSTSLIEAIACGVPVCITRFSSADELVSNGYNGYVSDTRDENEFVANMNRALKIPKTALLESSGEMNKYSVSRLKEDLLKYWQI